MSVGRFAYVIMCHHKSAQALRLARTIRRLSPDARVLIRHDRPTGYIDTAEATEAGAELLRSSITARWAEWSLVEATLEAYAAARERWDPDWIVIVSGQDYPIRSLVDWESEVRSGGEDAVVPGGPIADGPAAIWTRGSTDHVAHRYTHRWIFLRRLGLVDHMPSPLVRVIRAGWYRLFDGNQALVVLLALPRDYGWALGIRRRRVPWSSDAPVFKGEHWHALSRRAAASLLDSESESWRRYFATTFSPEESFFTTVLGNHPDLTVRRNRTSWLRWNGSPSEPHPQTMTAELLSEARASGAPFARKFDDAETPGMLDQIDQDYLGLDADA